MVCIGSILVTTRDDAELIVCDSCAQCPCSSVDKNFLPAALGLNSSKVLARPPQNKFIKYKISAYFLLLM